MAHVSFSFCVILIAADSVLQEFCSKKIKKFNIKAEFLVMFVSVLSVSLTREINPFSVFRTNFI